MRTRVRFGAIITAIGSTLALSNLAAAQVLTFSGRLNTSAGQPVSGNKEIQFAIYDELSGSNPALWIESQTVDLHGGNFTALLGEDVGNPLPTDLFDDGNRYLEMTLEPGTANEEVIAPRTLLGSVGNAFHASRADHANNSDHSDNSDHASNSDHSNNSDHANNSDLAEVANLALSVADNTVGSPQIIDGSILLQDLGQNGATTGQVMTWNGLAWAPSPVSPAYAFRTVTGSTDLAPEDCVVFVNGAGTVEITLPPAGLCAGRAYTIKRVVSTPGQVVVEAWGSETIEGGSTKNIGSNGVLTAFSDGVSWHVINYETSI
jgi:hypothetical protein